MAINQQRHTRYHCAGKQPPGLKEVLKQLAKAACGKGYIPDRLAATGLAARGYREYKNVNRANELVGFLKNTGVLIEAPKSDWLYFDADRARVVLECCGNRREPPPAMEDAVRIATILTLLAQPRPDQDDDESAPPVGASPSYAPLTQVVVTPSSSHLGTTCATHVLYLTPVEDDVWTAVCTEAVEIPPNVQAEIPWDACASRTAWVKSSLKCSETEYVCIMQRLVEAGILEHLDAKVNDRTVFRFTRHPFAFHVVRLAERQSLSIPVIELEAIRAAQAEFRIPKAGYFTPVLVAWAESRFGDRLNIVSWAKKVVGHRPDDKHKGWGIFFRKDSHPGRPKMDEPVETYMSIPGFEAYDFRRREEPAVSPVTSPLPETDRTPPDSTLEQPTEAPVCPVEPPLQPTIPVPVEPPPGVSIAEFSTEPTISTAVVVEPSLLEVESIEKMDSSELRQQLAAWRRMLEGLPLTIHLANAELARRNDERRRQLSARIAELRTGKDALEAMAKELEERAAEKRSLAVAKGTELVALETELAGLDA